VKLFQRTNEGFQRYVQQENTNYFIEDGVCDESTRTFRNNLQAANPYTVADLPAPTTDEPPELLETETDHIYCATNIIAASDSSVDPISGEATFNWRITTYDKRGLISKSLFVNSNPMYMNSYRGEMGGIQDLVGWIHATELQKKVIKIVCDNESCVKSLNRQGFSLVDLDKAESDLIRDITTKLKDFDDVAIGYG
jgi:hypothetical protein